MWLQKYVQWISKISQGNVLGTTIKSNEMLFNWETEEASILVK